MNEEHSELLDELEAKETAKQLPIGWVLLFVALILWGIFYVFTYTPAISGWSQAKAYEQSVKPSGQPDASSTQGHP